MADNGGEKRIPEMFNLGPRTDVLRRVYESALDQVFDENSTRTNIALSGPHGAGKSSVLLSYEKEKEKLRFLHISLGRFAPLKQETEQGQQSNQNFLEQKIVNQLLQQIDPKRIPQTVFSIKRKSNRRKIFGISVLIFICISAGFLAFNFSEFLSLFLGRDTVANLLKEGNSVLNISLISLFGLLFISGFIILLMFVGQWLLHRPFSRMKLAGNEIEFSEDSDLPFFDRYLDEILYIFNHADVDAVVFEDIDRFDDVEIFVRLREINSLLNGPKYIASRHNPIRFLYLVKDDIFSSADRVKFFDTIIPVVPVVNSGNSYDKFVEGLKRLSPDCTIDSLFLKGVSLHITDMRLVENICNEFMIYSRVLDTLQLDQNKLFALIVYKNIFPRDFTLLQQNRGYVHALFNSVSFYTKEMKMKLEQRIKENNEAITKSKNEVAESLDELKCIFKNLYGLSLDDAGYYTQRNKKALFDVYKERETYVRNKTRLPNLNQMVVDDSAQLASLNQMRLHDLIQYKNIDEGEIFRLGQFNSSESKRQIEYVTDSQEIQDVIGDAMFDLLKYLLRGGYIDETYSNYLTFFYATELSPEDMDFSLAIMDGKSAAPEYVIANPEKVVDSIPVQFFSREQILNYSLIHHLLQRHDERMSYIVGNLAASNNIAFISSYCSRYHEDLRLLSREICKYWRVFFELNIDNESFDNRLMKDIVSYTLSDCPRDEIAGLNTEQIITKYVNRTGCILHLNGDFDSSLFRYNLNEFAIRIEHIEIGEGVNQDVLKEIYEADAYELTIENVRQMYESFYENSNGNISLLEKGLLTMIYREESSPLAKYVDENLDEFISTWLSVCNKCMDDEEIALRILNDRKVTDENKEKYLMALETKITHVEAVSDRSLLDSAIQNGKVEYSTHNLIELFEHDGNKTNNRVSKLIANNGSSLSVSEDDLEKRNQMIRALILDKEISDERALQIVNACKFLFAEFNLSSLSGDRLSMLIHEDVIPMNEASYSYIHNYYNSSLRIEYLSHRFEEYLTMLGNDDCYFEDDVLEILASKKLNKTQKKKLLSKVVKEGYLQMLPISGSEYDDVICFAISLGIIDEDGFRILFKRKDSLTKQVETEIVRWAVKSWDVFLEKCAPVADENLCQYIFGNQKFGISQKRQLFIDRMDDFSIKFMNECISDAGFRDIAECLDKEEGSVPATAENLEVLKQLSRRGLISFSPSENEDSYHIAQKKPDAQD